MKNACVVAFPGMHKLQANCQLACVNLTEMLVMCSTVPSCLKRVGLKVDQLFVLRKKKFETSLFFSFSIFSCLYFVHRKGCPNTFLPITRRLFFAVLLHVLFFTI